MATGYDRFVRNVGDNKFFTDATGAFRGVILAEDGLTGVAVKALGHDLVGEPFSFYIDSENKMQRHAEEINDRRRARAPHLYELKSRNALDYVERMYAY